MATNLQSSYRDKLYSQIVDAHAKLQYTLSAHEKDREHLVRLNTCLRWAQIVLSAVTAGSFLPEIFSHAQSRVIGALCAFLLLILNAVTKNMNPAVAAEKHQQAADQLWRVREKYVSLLTDFDTFDEETAKNRRDALSEEVGQLYASTIRTTRYGYKKAQKALKQEEEQTFNEGEAEQLLPVGVRTRS